MPEASTMLEAAQWQMPTERRDFGIVEVDAVGQPGARREPAVALQEVEGTTAVALQAEAGLLRGLGEVGVERAIETFGERCGLAHEPLGHGERRAGCESDLDVGSGRSVVEEGEDALAVAQDRILVLDHGIGRQSTVLLRQVHGAARHGHAQPDLPRRLDLDVDRLLQPGRVQVMMIGRRGAARHQQFDEGDPHRRTEVVGREPRPDRVERLQPREQRLVDRRGMGAGQRLVEMVMRVDETRQHDMAPGIEDPVRPFGFMPGRDQAFDLPPPHHDAALGAVGQDGQRVLDPQPILGRSRAQQRTFSVFSAQAGNVASASGSGR